jgi:uncharacterized protein YegJ (DUF2314 family)
VNTARAATIALMLFTFLSKLLGASERQRDPEPSASVVASSAAPVSQERVIGDAAEKRQLILCIPGPWADRTEFIQAVITRPPAGKFMFAGGILADLTSKDHVALEFCPKDPRLARSFEVAGQGKIPTSCLQEVDQHGSVLYLHFPLDIVQQRERLLKFTRFIRQLGGIAVKVESSGTAHTWESWEKLLTGSMFDLYCAAVVLVGDKDVFYSCGMHHFGLPECAVPRDMDTTEGADLMNRFNVWQINERPTLKSGETFSLSADRPAFRLHLERDARHGDGDLFHNPHGVWRLEATDSVGSNKWKKPEDEPLFVAIAQNDPKMAEAYATAKATFPDFLKATKSTRFANAVNGVKLKLRDDKLSAEQKKDRFAYLWVWDVREDSGGFRARPNELPKEGFNNLVVGEDIHFTADAVHDWMLREGSQAWGAFTMRVARDRMDAKERLQFDEYTGILEYNDHPFAGTP